MSAAAHISQPPAPVKLTREEREAWEPHLELLFPAKTMLRPDELTGPLGCDLKTIARLFASPDAARLLGIELNAGSDQRQHRRVLRDAAVLFYIRRANHVPADFYALCRSVFAQRSVRELVLLQQMLGEELRKKL